MVSTNYSPLPVCTIIEGICTHPWFAYALPPTLGLLELREQWTDTTRTSSTLTHVYLPMLHRERNDAAHTRKQAQPLTLLHGEDAWDMAAILQVNPFPLFSCDEDTGIDRSPISETGSVKIDRRSPCACRYISGCGGFRILASSSLSSAGDASMRGRGSGLVAD
jgi:hypothetical protein